MFYSIPKWVTQSSRNNIETIPVISGSVIHNYHSFSKREYFYM